MTLRHDVPAMVDAVMEILQTPVTNEAPARKHVIPAELIVRGTTGPPSSMR